MSTKIAHFLLHDVLTGSPPNTALKRAYKALGADVVEFAPGALAPRQEAQYGAKWLLKNAFNPKWRQFDAFSCTSQDPIALAGALALIWRKPLIFLADEIRAGSYGGERPGYWKKWCRFLMRRAELTVVNDVHRIALQQEYAGLSARQEVLVYPGCFTHPPQGVDRGTQRMAWGVSGGAPLLGFSGNCDLNSGIDLALGALDTHPDLHCVTQPLGLDPMRLLLLRNHKHHERLYVQTERLTWQDAWAQCAAVDVGVAFYRNPAPQFQTMGISSNRLCMFLAMGVPVIVNKQPSFDFIDEFECGVQVETQDEFDAALAKLLGDLPRFKANALRCTREYIDAEGKFQALEQALKPHLTS